MERELVTPFGRLDLVIRDPHFGVLCVEVKTESDPGQDQLERYLNWLATKSPQFRREAQEAIRAAIDERIDDIAAVLKLDKAELVEGLTPYADPANFGQSWTVQTPRWD